MRNIKHYIYLLLNGVLLRPFNLVLSYNIGRNPFDDLKKLFDGKRMVCAIDGGAYRGEFSIDITDHFPTATVYAFEPQRDSFALLSDNVSGSKGIRPINCALGEKSGEATLYRNASAMTNSLSQSTEDALKYFEGYNDPVGEEKVNVIALADFLVKEGIEDIDLLKLDLQGHELRALRGLGNRLSSVKSVYIEVEFLRLYDGAALFSEVEPFLCHRCLFWNRDQFPRRHWQNHQSHRRKQP